MADKTIADLTAATTLSSSDVLEVQIGANSRKITATNLAKSLTPLGFRGAKAVMTSDDTTQNIQAGDTAIPFDSASFDTDSFWAGGAPTRLTIPAGIAYVELVGQVNITTSTADSTLKVGIYHYNSADVAQAIYGNRFVEMGGTARSLQAVTGPVAVSSGDYFTLTAKEETDNSVTIEGNGALKTFLALKVLG